MFFVPFVEFVPDNENGTICRFFFEYFTSISASNLSRKYRKKSCERSSGMLQHHNVIGRKYEITNDYESTY